MIELGLFDEFRQIFTHDSDSSHGTSQPRAQCIPGSWLVHYMEPEQQDADSTFPIVLNFADGTTATTDVLVGSDGIRSTVRKTLFEAASEDKTGGGRDRS
ncbi:hypothetical protein J3R82DRAFT_7951 [Butyriboletus roseoflavus]|nr:hypothetical protein J3R82DRAFT_7951 [Butyriboletus roseoflavus]